jgi:hypothetical protein
MVKEPRIKKVWAQSARLGLELPEAQDAFVEGKIHERGAPKPVSTFGAASPSTTSPASTAPAANAFSFGTTPQAAAPAPPLSLFWTTAATTSAGGYIPRRVRTEDIDFLAKKHGRVALVPVSPKVLHSRQHARMPSGQSPSKGFVFMPLEKEPTPLGVPYAAHLPFELSELHGFLKITEIAIYPDVANDLSALLQLVGSSPIPSDSSLLAEFAALNRTGSSDVREVVVKRMEAVRHLAGGIEKIAESLERRQAWLESLTGEIAVGAEKGMLDKELEITRLDEAVTSLDEEKRKAVEGLEDFSVRLGELETLGVPMEASYAALLEASEQVCSAIICRKTELASDRERMNQERIGLKNTADAARAVASHLATQISAATASKLSLEAVLQGTKTQHAGYLGDLVARSSTLLLSIRGGMERADAEAKEALEVSINILLRICLVPGADNLRIVFQAGHQSRHDRLENENRTLKREFEDANRLKLFYEQCLARLDHSGIRDDPEPVVEQAQAEVNSDSQNSEPGLSDAGSSTEYGSAIKVTGHGLRHLAISDRETGSGIGVMEEIDLHSRGAPSQQDAPIITPSELSADSFSRIDHGELRDDE